MLEWLLDNKERRIIMPCIFDFKKEDRYCQYCSAICDERQPKPIEQFATNKIELYDRQSTENP